MPGAGRQIELRRCLLQQLAAGSVGLAAGIDLLGAQTGIGLLLAGMLPLLRLLDARPNGGEEATGGGQYRLV